MIHSHLQYCISSWFFNNKTHTQRLQKIVNKVICIVFNVSNKYNSAEAIKTPKILSLEQNANLKTVVFMQKYFNHALPPAFNDLFHQSYRDQMHNYFRSSAD